MASCVSSANMYLCAQICICVPSCESLVLPLRICLYKTQHASAWMVHRHLSAGSLGSVSHLLFCVCIVRVFVCCVKLDLASISFSFLNCIVSLVVCVDS